MHKSRVYHVDVHVAYSTYNVVVWLWVIIDLAFSVCFLVHVA